MNIAQELDHPDVLRIVLQQGLEQARRRVTAAVVDEEELPAPPERRERRGDPAVQLAQVLLLVVDRHDEGEIRPPSAHLGHRRRKDTLECCSL